MFNDKKKFNVNLLLYYIKISGVKLLSCDFWNISHIYLKSKISTFHFIDIAIFLHMKFEPIIFVLTKSRLAVKLLLK